MNPTISIPRQNSLATSYGGTTPTSRSSEGLRMPRFFKQLHKFRQMDFEMATREMIDLLIAPKQVFKSLYYHKQTKNTWHRPDPSFTWLFSFFMLLTGIAWGVATSYAPQKILYVALSFVFIHFLLLSVIIATISYFVVGRLLGPGIQGLPGRRRQQGLFGGGEGGGEGEKLEFGYCFDVAIRAFFPVWLLIYVLQFILWPLLSTHYWLSLFFGNTLYLIAATYYFVITFLGYNALPFLNHTQFLLSPLLVFGVLWFVTLFGLNVPLTFAPFMVRGFAARRS